MKKSQRLCLFLCGMLVAVLLLPSALAAAGMTITVSPGISIFVNDQKVEPKDANGNPVEVFVYNGTTYLPVRAVSEALNMPVLWEDSTRSVYVGRHASEKPAVMLKDLDYYAGTADGDFHTADTEKDNLGNTHTDCITQNFDRSYNLKGQYSRMTGTLYQTYERRSYHTVGYNEYNRLEIYGDGNLLFKKSFDVAVTAIEPIPFDINLEGVQRLQVRFSTEGQYRTRNEGDLLSVGEIALYT